MLQVNHHESLFQHCKDFQQIHAIFLLEKLRQVSVLTKEYNSDRQASIVLVEDMWEFSVLLFYEKSETMIGIYFKEECYS